MSGPTDVTGTGDLPDDRDLDEGGLDLSPRQVAPGRAGRSATRRWMPLIVLGVLALVLGFIVYEARDASLYFRNADEAVAQKKELGTKKFRLQGTVVGTPRENAAGTATVFTVEYNDVQVKVRHTGSEPAMFKKGIPVVAEGHWNEAGTEFDSERLLVKHDENYEDEHPDRVKDEQKPQK